MRPHAPLLLVLAVGCSSQALPPDAGSPPDAAVVDGGADPASSDGGAEPDAGSVDEGPTDEAIQRASWRVLPEAPRIDGKQDDLYFVTPELGWSVNGRGEIHRTRDGGDTWTQLVDQPGTFFRAILFTSETRGFVANIGPNYFPGVTDDVPLYETRDGGETWTELTRIVGPRPTGICNFHRVDDQHLVAVGRVGGPSFVMTSSTGGDSWRSVEITADIAMLIDARFTSATEGLVIGGSSTNLGASRTIVLRTEDGGASWTEVYRSETGQELGWKLSFPTPEVGYASVLAYHDDSAVLKTTDGGRSWRRIPLGVGRYEAKGIGFVNARIGWLGGERFGRPSYRTVDGGETWTEVRDLGPLVNRFRFPDPYTGFAIGAGIDRLDIPRTP